MSDEESYEYEYDSDASMPDAADDDDGNNHSNPSDNDDDEDEFIYTDDEDNDHDNDHGDDPSSNNYEVSIENEYYNAKEEREDNPKEAYTKFERVIQMEQEHNHNDDDGSTTNVISWTFKALKQSMKLRLKYDEYEEAKGLYRRLLEVVSDPNNRGVSPNDLEKGVNNMLERVSSILFHDRMKMNQQTQQQPTSMSVDGADWTSDSNNSSSAQSLAWYVWDATLQLFHPNSGACPNSRQWFNTNLKYGQLLYENHQTSKLQSVIQDLLRHSNNNNNNNNYNMSTSSLSSTFSTSSNSTSSTNLMEIYALQIQLYSRMKDHKKLRDIYTKAMKVQGGIPHPRTIGLIQELGGKMHMSSREYELANTAFFQAFKSYDEAGDYARLRCLKYLVLASMLHASSINPFDSQEVRPYKEDPEIVAMTKLVNAFHSNDIETFDRILKKNEGRIMDDEFIRTYIADLLWTIRMQVLIDFLRPYTRISIASISKKLNGIALKDAENLLVTAILDGKLDGRIDQVNGVLLKNKDMVNNGSGVVGGNGGQSSDGSEEHGDMNTNLQGDDSGGGNDGNKSGTYSMGDENTMTLPIWGENSIPVQTCAAMENLMNQMESVTLAVTAMNSKVSNTHMISYLKSG